MKRGIIRSLFGGVLLALIVATALQAQQDTSGVQQNAGQASQPAAAPNGPAGVGSNTPGSTTIPPAPTASTTGNTGAAAATTKSGNTGAEDNPYDPYLEPPPLPKGSPTLIGGLASSVDHVRNHITVQPFGRGQKVKVFVDERSHIYRNGVETTILGVHKGDRVYVDTMLDTNNKIFARNVRVLTETGLAEVRGQVISVNPEKGTISMRDQLSARPVSFAVSGATKYSSSKGSATPGDVQPGSLIDVQFSSRPGDRAVAQEVVVLARPGDNYIFSGVVTNLDMRTHSFFVDNRSDDQSYEVHFTPAAVSDVHALKVGSEITARAIFDGKKYEASNIRIENSGQEQSEQSKAQ